MCDQQSLRSACAFAAIDRTSFGVSKLNRRLHRLVWVYTYQNATLLKITCPSWFSFEALEAGAYNWDSLCSAVLDSGAYTHACLIFAAQLCDKLQHPMCVSILFFWLINKHWRRSLFRSASKRRTCILRFLLTRRGSLFIYTMLISISTPCRSKKKK